MSRGEVSELLAGKERFDGVDGCLTADFADGLGQRQFLRTDFDAVLRVTAVGDSTGFLHDLKPVVLVDLAGLVHVEVGHLAEDLRTDELVINRELRARLKAAAAGHTAGQRVAAVLFGGRLLRAGPQRMGAVDRHPTFDSFEILEHPLPLDAQVADDRKLLHRFEHDDILSRLSDEVVDQCGTCLPCPSVDIHRA